MALFVNRVYDPDATAFVRWSTAVPDPTGDDYPGPAVFGDVLDYCIESEDVGGEGGGGEAALVVAFDDSDLTAGVLTISHGFTQQYVITQIYDENDLEIGPDETTAVDSATVEVDLSSYGTIAGTWHAVVSGGSTTGGGGGDGTLRGSQWWAESSTDAGEYNENPDIVHSTNFTAAWDRINLWDGNATLEATMPAATEADHNRIVAFMEANADLEGVLTIVPAGSTTLNYGILIAQAQMLAYGPGAIHVFRYDTTIDKFRLVQGAEALSNRELAVKIGGLRAHFTLEDTDFDVIQGSLHLWDGSVANGTATLPINPEAGWTVAITNTAEVGQLVIDGDPQPIYLSPFGTATSWTAVGPYFHVVLRSRGGGQGWVVESGREFLRGGTAALNSVMLNNAEGDDLGYGEAVYLSASLAISRAQADAEATAQFFGGVQPSGILDGEDGLIQYCDLLTIPTTLQEGGAWAFGDIIYLSAATAGAYTKVAPTTVGEFVVRIGRCINTPTGGDARVAMHTSIPEEIV